MGDNSVLTVKPSSGHRVIGIEGLRGLAAFSVVFHHVGAHLGGSGAAKWVSVAAEHGLTLFFVLSGFLLYQPFVRGVRAGQFPNVRRYFRNRAVRILPGYLAIFILVSFVFGAAYVHGAPQAHVDNPVGYLTDPGAILADLFLVQTYFPQYLMTGIGPAWSLTAEILFYLALPCLAYLALIAARRMRLKYAVLLPAYLLIGIGLAATAWSFLARRGMDDAESFLFSWGNTWTAVAERSFFAQADLFGYGMIAAAVISRVNEGLTKAPTIRYKLILSITIVVLAGLAASGVLRGASANAMGVACAMALLLVVLPPSGAFTGQGRIPVPLEWTPLRYAGLISYSVYLWHVPVIWWLKDRGLNFGNEALIPNFLIVAALTMALATVTYYGIEAQAYKFRAKATASPQLERAGRKA